MMRTEAQLRRIIDAIPVLAWCNRPHSPFLGDANEEEDRVVLLAAPLDARHRGSRRNREFAPRYLVGGTAATIFRSRRVTRGATSEMRHIMKRRAVGELPTRGTVLVDGMNRQD